jgi:hypothetical protein
LQQYNHRLVDSAEMIWLDESGKNNQMMMGQLGETSR